MKISVWSFETLNIWSLYSFFWLRGAPAGLSALMCHAALSQLLQNDLSAFHCPQEANQEEEPQSVCECFLPWCWLCCAVHLVLNSMVTIPTFLKHFNFSNKRAVEFIYFIPQLILKHNTEITAFNSQVTQDRAVNPYAYMCFNNLVSKVPCKLEGRFQWLG